jgi:hypothetical protein
MGGRLIWPEDAYTLYDTYETEVTLVAGTPGVLITPDPQRIYLGLTCSQGTCYATINPPAAGNKGIPLSSTGPTTFREWEYLYSASLCGQGWYGFSAAGAVVCVHYVRLARHGSLDRRPKG